ncbi:two-component system VirA-like sensor kinase [Hypericibacter sp.]|uniref:two-component system VirA-like sensor kinase n=1 Tax=Hypericibacter sp. TaxID=2705401 RepID=UPI003D6D1327
MRLVQAATAALLLVMLLTWLSFRAINSQAELFDQALTALDDFSIGESGLEQDVLTARAGLLRNYDPLVQKENRIKEALIQLRTIAEQDPDIGPGVGLLMSSAAHQEGLLESFKSNNALLQNSLAYFGLFSDRLAGSNGNESLVPVVGALATAMLHLTLDTSSETARLVDDRLDDLAALTPTAASADSIRALLAHGRLLRNLLPETDSVLTALLDASGMEEQRALRSVILRQQQASRDIARVFRGLLYVTSLLLFGLLVHLGLRLRQRTLALQWRAAVEHKIAGISTRLIAAQPSELAGHIEQALAEMADCVGADRAYLMLPSRRTPTQAWCRKGVGFPVGWPDGAPMLSRRFHPTSEGIIHVPHVDRLMSGLERGALQDAGVRGWACATRGEGESVDALLGFDLLSPARRRQQGGLGLLRVVLDALANAAEREFFDQEQARLEKRLQQARRMETIGALASGIAHNFNNIVGAILGYTEIAEAQVAPDSGPARNLAEIRQSGERARDLIDQILTFGRRRDVRRTPIGMKVLMAETESLLRASLPPRVELVVPETREAATIFGEPEQLQQVIVNLAKNAAQAMGDAGRVQMEWELQEVAWRMPLTCGELTPGRHVRIAVSDSGCGMDHAVLDKIFDPFFTTRLAGNGLGLATVREIVLEHGGAIKVWSKPEVGSRFEVWLPCFAAAEPPREENAPALPFGEGETILVIDQDRRRLLRHEEMLAALGYEPVGFMSPAEALTVCEMTPGRFDALVIGNVGADSAIDLAQALQPLAPHLPIILAMSSPRDTDVDALVAAGIREVVRQPLNSVEIAEALARALAGAGGWRRSDRASLPGAEALSG